MSSSYTECKVWYIYSKNQPMVVWIAVWTPENERDCYVWGIPKIPQTTDPNHQQTIS